MRATLFAALLALTADSGINIRLNKQVVMHGGEVWLTCRVTPNKYNRTLIFGIGGTERERSERQLDGYDAPITWGPMPIKNIPCNAGPAYCVVVRADGTSARAMLTIEVAGCEP